MFYRFVLLTCLLCLSYPAYSETRNFYGMRGLNTIPDARFDQKGTVTFTLSHADPYAHGALGFQFTDNLYISLRQTAEAGNPFDTADGLYPGIDTKIKLLDETAQRPQIALGLQSAFGHTLMKLRKDPRLLSAYNRLLAIHGRQESIYPFQRDGMTLISPEVLAGDVLQENEHLKIL